MSERRSKIANGEDRGISFPTPYPGSAESKHIPVVRVEASSLIYRIANGRTLVEQLEKIRELGVSDDFFIANEENVEVQRLQHEILLRLAQSETKNIYTELAESGVQRDPLLVTTSGVIVNGNRRLASMRELLSRESNRFRQFSLVDVAVLPDDYTESTINKIETMLQIAPDLKLEYGWVEEALKLRDQVIRFKWSMPECAGLWGQKVEYLEARLRQLQLAEEYLEWLGMKGQFKQVADKEQVFSDLDLHIQQLIADSPGQIQHADIRAQKLLMFVVFSSEQISGRKYEYVKAATEITERTLEKLNAYEETDSEPSTDQNDPLAAAPSGERRIRANVMSDLAAPDDETRETLASYAEESRDEIRAERRIRDRGDALRKVASECHRKLKEVQLRDADRETYSQTVPQLVEISVYASKLLKDILLDAPSTSDELNIAHQNRLVEAVKNLKIAAEQIEK